MHQQHILSKDCLALTSGISDRDAFFVAAAGGAAEDDVAAAASAGAVAGAG